METGEVPRFVEDNRLPSSQQPALPHPAISAVRWNTTRNNINHVAKLFKQSSLATAVKYSTTSVIHETGLADKKHLTAFLLFLTASPRHHQ
jgi:hypothetical protein